MITAEAIIKRIESLGYKVSGRIITSSWAGFHLVFIELFAIKMPEGKPLWMARTADCDGEAALYVAAKALVDMMGIV